MKKTLRGVKEGQLCAPAHIGPGMLVLAALLSILAGAAHKSSSSAAPHAQSHSPSSRPSLPCPSPPRRLAASQLLPRRLHAPSTPPAASGVGARGSFMGPATATSRKAVWCGYVECWVTGFNDKIAPDNIRSPKISRCAGSCDASSTCAHLFTSPVSSQTSSYVCRQIQSLCVPTPEKGRSEMSGPVVRRRLRGGLLRGGGRPSAALVFVCVAFALVLCCSCSVFVGPQGRDDSSSQRRPTMLRTRTGTRLNVYTWLRRGIPKF